MTTLDPELALPGKRASRAAFARAAATFDTACFVHDWARARLLEHHGTDAKELRHDGDAEPEARGQHDGTNRIDKRLDELADVARTLAKEQKVPLNDLRKAFVEHWKEHNKENKPSGVLTYDGNHFNDAGHRFVAEQMLKKLE